MNRKQLAKKLNTVFGWGVFLVVIAGALSFFGFIIALILGGESGEALAVFIKAQYFPKIITVTSVVIGIGLIAMYVGGESALSLITEKKEAEEELDQIKRDQKGSS